MSFKSGYQGGPYFELFSTQGRDLLANWKGVLSSKKIYEKEVKGYVLCLEGAPATTKIQSPKDQKQSLTLVQRFLILQVQLTKGADFSVELGVTDLSNNKRRLLLSTAQKETQVTPLHAKIPLAVVRRAVWVNLVLDMVSLVGETWTSQTFRSVDQISVSANCKVRRIFTMRAQPPDTTDDDELYGCSSTNNGELDSIPKQCQIAPDVSHITQVLTLNKIKSAERLKSGKAPSLGEQFRPGSTLDLDLSASGRKVTTTDGKIAFGSKAPRAPDTGRKSARQGSVTTRSFRSQTSRVDAVSNSNNSALVALGGEETGDASTYHDESSLPYSGGDGVRPRPPVSANAVTSAASSVTFTRQQSEPVTHDDFGFITNGMKGLMDKQQLVAPHPPREPSNDRARRRPRIKSFGQNCVTNRGDSSIISPPSSASVHPTLPTSGQPGSTLSPGTARIRQRSHEVNSVSGVSGGRMKDSGVGPDVPEIQSPRKGEPQTATESFAYNEMDSVADVISLLKDAEERIGAESRLSMDQFSQQRVAEDDPKERRRRNNRVNGRPTAYVHTDRRHTDDLESNVSSSASESSHPGEYEDSDEENNEDSKLHLFVSPPKSAGMRRNISPNTPDAETHQSKKSLPKTFRSKRNTDSASSRGARLEDDFVSHSSSDDDAAAVAAEMLHLHNHAHHHSQLRIRRSANGVPHARPQHSYNNSRRSNTSGYNSANYTTSSSSVSASTRSSGHGMKMKPIASASPDQRLTFDPKLYADPQGVARSGQNTVSRLSRKSLREITNPCMDTAEGNNGYDFSKYTTSTGDLTESFEAGMFASMRRQTEAALEDVAPVPAPTAGSLTLTQQFNGTNSLTITTHSHLCSESPATTSDDDTSFSTWKPAQNQVPHNYNEEMKSQRSSDTLTSSNPRDWSGVMSPPIMSNTQDLQGTMEGISDDLSDEAPLSRVPPPTILKPGLEEEKLDLLFDPKLECYFDPKTNKWYELAT